MDYYTNYIKGRDDWEFVSVYTDEGITQVQLAEKVGTSAPYVNRVIKNPDGVVNKTFLSMMEQLGYDVELTYVKRES